ARGALERDLTGKRYKGREIGERHMPERLEDLLVGPAVLPGLLVEVDRDLAAVVEHRLEVAQQRGLALVAGGEPPRQLDLVQAQPDCPARTGVHGDVVFGAAVLADGERDPLLSRG